MCLVDTAYDEGLREFAAYEVKITDVESMRAEASEVIGDESGEFGKALVDHFPVEDGMPSFSDVRDFMQNWVDRDFYDEAVDTMCLVMEFIYPM